MTSTDPAAVDVPVIAALMSPEHLADPYATYARLRETTPVAEIPEMNAWLLTRFEDVKAAFKDDRLGVAFSTMQVNRQGPDVVDEPYFRIGQDLLVCNDPPVHTRLRRVFRAPFTPARVQALGPTVERLCEEALQPVLEARGGDVNADFARRLPLETISALLEVRPEDVEQIGRWVYDFAPVLEFAPMSAEVLGRVNAALQGLEAYFTDLVAQRRARPGDDFVSAVIAANDADPEPMSEAEVVNNISLLYFAGQDTQKYQVTNMVAALAQHPDALAALQQDVARVDDAMPELLRYDTVGQLMGRTAVEDVDLGGATIRTGQSVMVCMGAANRDPAQFPEPDRLVLDRPATTSLAQHLTFGAGRHRCIGMHLASMQMPIMLKVLLQSTVDLEVDLAAASRHPSIATRGFDALPFRCRPA